MGSVRVRARSAERGVMVPARSVHASGGGEVGGERPEGGAGSFWGTLTRWARQCWDSLFSARNSVREDLLAEVAAAVEGRPRVDTAGGATTPGAALMAAQLRATRAPATERGARYTLRQLAQFVEANSSLAADAEELTEAVWDAVMEAFLIAKVDPPHPHGWRRLPGWGRVAPSGAGASVAAATAALGRLGRGPTAWPRTAAMRRALGCGDADDVVRVEPIFAWEVWQGVRNLGSALSVWELGARALVALGTVCGGRTGSMSRVLLEELQSTDDPRVWVFRPRAGRGAPAREKQQRARATMRGRRRGAATLTLEHWALQACVAPWVRVLRSWGCVGSMYLFPSLVRRQHGRARAVQDGLWMDEARPWTARAVLAALRFVVGERLEGRSWQGLRAGGNMELRRFGDAVTDATRRTLHGRTLRPLLGSEVAYAEVFGEEIRDATRRLGELRVERIAGQLVTTGVSPSAGEFDDWEEMPVARPLGVDPPSSESSDDDDSRAVEGGECGRCFRLLGVRDHAWLCDEPACSWAVCLACHPGGQREPLWCPRHAP